MNPARTDAPPTSTPNAEDRFSRLGLIGWWDQRKIEAAKVLVVGAGALGNEILKNLALLGCRRVVVVDGDRIELSNLSRSVLYRASDVGRFKAEAAAGAFRELYPDAQAHGLVGDIVHTLGLGLFHWADLVIAGLDNREARLWINRSAWKLNRPWIDGAIETINGVARVFLPGVPPCYECTFGETDWAILNKRMSCNLLTRAEAESGKVPTTPTISSIIAGIQVQEAMKLIHGLPVIAGQGFVFEGLNHTSYKVEYTESPDCQSHYTLPDVVRLPQRSADLTLRELHAMAVERFDGAPTVLDFSRDVIAALECTQCGGREELFAPVGTVEYARGYCPNDGEMRRVVTIHQYTGSEPFGERRLSELGLPLFDILTARSGERETGYLLGGDAPQVLGPLVEAL